MKIVAREAAGAAQARLLHPQLLPLRLRFSTDTRALQRGDAFIALRGEHFDGHTFVSQALERGASALVVENERVVPDGVPAFVVADTRAAYLAFASVARDALRVRVAAITGSTGKTTTKSFLQQLLERAGEGPVAASDANENNEIGVAKLLTSVDPQAAFVVIEMGARHDGEIAPLVRAARPHVAVLTNVGDAHLETMGSPERLARTKWGIFATGAQAVLSGDDAVSLQRSPQLEREPHWFRACEGTPPAAEHRTETIVAGRSQLIVRRDGGERGYAIDCRFAGAHNLANLAAAASAALELGVPPERIAAGVSYLELPPGRYERTRVGEVELFYDAYNASMSGTLATLRSFAREGPGRRIAVLASMAELGEAAPEMHERVGEAAAAAGIDTLLVGGAFADALARGARRAGIDGAKLVHFADNEAAIAWLRSHMRAGDVVLLKGSRKYRLEQVRDGLGVTHA